MNDGYKVGRARPGIAAALVVVAAAPPDSAIGVPEWAAGPFYVVVARGVFICVCVVCCIVGCKFY